MKGSFGRELVNEVIANWEEVNVVHDHVVTLILAQQEPDIEQGSAVESERKRFE